MTDIGTPWVDLDDDWRASVLEDITLHTESTLPGNADLSWRDLGCYPNYALIRVRLGKGRKQRETYLFWRQGEVHPLDWTATPLNELNPNALEIRDAADAEEYLRFFCWAVSGDEGRFFITEQVADLALVDGQSLEPEVEKKLAEALRPLELSPPEGGDSKDRFRFKAPVVYGTGLFDAEFTVSRAGAVQLVDDVPIETDLPVREDRLGSDRYFVLVLKGGQAMSAEDFLAALVRGESIGTEPPPDGEDADFRVRVLGHVDARGRTFAKPVEIERVQFNGDLSFEGATFECPVRMDRCYFYGRLDLDGVTVDGTFAARRIRMGRARHVPGQSRAVPRVSAKSIQTTGSLDFQGLWSMGPVDLAGARVGADLRLGAIVLSVGNYDWSPTPSGVDALSLRGADIGGNLDFFTSTGQAKVGVEYLPEFAARDIRPAADKATAAIHGRLEGGGMRVGGRTILSGLRCHDSIRLELCDFEGGVEADQLSTGGRLVVRNDFILTQGRIRGSLNLGGAWIGRDLWLAGTEVTGFIMAHTSRKADRRLAHLTVGGQFELSGTRAQDVIVEGGDVGLFRMITGHIDRLFLTAGIEEVPDWRTPSEQALLDWGGIAQVAADEDPNSVEVGRWRLRPCELGGIRIQSATFANALYLSCVQVREKEGDPEPGVAIIGQVDVGGSALFSFADPVGSLTDPPQSPFDWEDHEAPDPQSIRTEVPGDLDLRSLHVGEHLDLSGILVGGSIDLENATVGLDLSMARLGLKDENAEHRTPTTCARLDLEALTCNGDADLTGLEVVPSDDPDGPRADVHARRLKVGGKLLFSSPLGSGPHDYTKIPEDPKQRLDARIHGLLDLGTAEAAHLVISGDSFRQPDPDRGISFERGRFGRFQIIDPLPASYDLSNVVVDRWEIQRSHLFQFLDGARPFQRSTYLALERSLRNDGDDETADEVYRSMRRKAIEELETGSEPSGAKRSGSLRRIRSWWRATRWRLFGLATGWGTQNFRPLLVGALLLPLSIAVFAQAENVSPSLEARGTDPATGTVLDARRLDPAWGMWDGTWMALRYHVPIIPLMARADFVPARTPAVIPIPGTDSELRAWFSAEGYAYSIYLLHWILWPLFLVGLTSRIIRTRE